MDVPVAKDECRGADGEVVWSWPPGAEACAMRESALSQTGAKEPVPGEITYKP